MLGVDAYTDHVSHAPGGLAILTLGRVAVEDATVVAMIAIRAGKGGAR
jgi:hypothetical protein